MSLQKKMDNAAAEAATHAVQTEQARCLWLLDCMEESMTATSKNKIWSAAQRHIVETKMELTRALVAEIKQAIIAGLRPPTPFSILRQPVNDVGEMQTRCSDLVDVLQRLGWEGESTVANVQEQIREWSRQEDKIDELEAKIEELETKV